MPGLFFVRARQKYPALEVGAVVGEAVATQSGLNRAVRVRLDLSYDGSGFSGWAAQPSRRTVAGVLTAALAREDEAPAAPAAGAAPAAAAAAAPAAATAAEEPAPASSDVDAPDQDSEPPVSASGDKGAEGPGDQAEGEDEDVK